jgi:hypothetical protein
MASLGEAASDPETLGHCLQELLELQRVAADETNAQVFFVQLQEIKVMQALIFRRLRELIVEEMERAGYEVNLTGTQ